MEMVESLIKQNLNNNTAVNELQGRIGILKSDLSKHHEKLVKLDNIIMDFYVKLHNLGLDGRLVKNELDKLKLEQYLQTVGSYALTVHNDIQTIITARLFAKTILSELILSTKHLPNHLHYPYTLLEQNTEGIMDLSNIKVFRVNQLLVFIISNPLTVDEVFMAFFKSKLAKFVSKNLELPIISVQIFEDLNKAGTSIKSVLNNDEILISNFNILLILIIITTITIVMLVVSVY